MFTLELCLPHLKGAELGPQTLPNQAFSVLSFPNLVVVEQILETFVCSIPSRNLERLIRIAKLLRKMKKFALAYSSFFLSVTAMCLIVVDFTYLDSFV